MEEIKRNYDRLAATYGTVAKDTGWLAYQDTVRKKVAGMIVQKKGLLLEIGCGNGLFLRKLLALKEIMAVGLDFSGRMLDVAEKQLSGTGSRIVLVKGTAQEMPFPDESFDIVTNLNMISTLPTYKDVKTVIREMVRVCRKNGCLILEIRNRMNPLISLQYGLTSRKSFPKKTYYTKEITEVLKKSGCRIIRVLPVYPSIKPLALSMIIESEK